MFAPEPEFLRPDQGIIVDKLVDPLEKYLLQEISQGVQQANRAVVQGVSSTFPGLGNADDDGRYFPILGEVLNREGIIHDIREELECLLR